MAATARRNLTVSASRSTSFRPAEQDLGAGLASVFKTASAQNGFTYQRVRVFDRACSRPEPRHMSSGALPGPSLLRDSWRASSYGARVSACTVSAPGEEALRVRATRASNASPLVTPPPNATPRTYGTGHAVAAKKNSHKKELTIQTLHAPS